MPKPLTLTTNDYLGKPNLHSRTELAKFLELFTIECTDIKINETRRQIASQTYDVIKEALKLPDLTGPGTPANYNRQPIYQIT